MMDSYIKLALTALLPVAVSIIFYFLDTKTSFGKINYAVKQVIYGIVFGAIAVFGTEYGIPVNGAQVNARDAAVLCGGLFFGGPAGIIAGIIGGAERWVAVAWGVGTFTRVACSISTMAAGFISAILRKFFFENKYPNWVMGFATGAVVETFHMTMVFLTNLSQMSKAISVIQACMMPMVIANAASVMIGSFILRKLSKQRVSVFKRDSVKITDTVQKWLFIVVIIALILSSAFIVELQSQSSANEVEKYLRLACEDVEDDITDAIEKSIAATTRSVVSEIGTMSLDELAEKYEVAEINIVNKWGRITESTNPDFVNFDFNSGDQSKEFMILLAGTSYYSQAYGPISYDASISRKYAGVPYTDGFVQIGYDAQHFQNLVASKVSDSTANTHVGENGFVVISDSARILVSIPKFIDTRNFAYTYLLGQFTEEDMPFEDEVFPLTIFGTEYYGRYHNVEGYSILAVMSMDEAANARDAATYASNFMEVLIMAVLFILIYNLIKKVVVDQLREVTGSLRKIAAGDLDEVVKVRTNEEFAVLSDDINATVDTLKKYIDEAAARIDADLTMAKEIQASALPSIFPAYPNRNDFDIYARMDTAKEVGGDFYDFYLTHHNVINFLIADVSGKGIPAAMFMMRAKTQLQSLTKSGKPINEVFQIGNNALCEGNDAGMFVTAWEGCMNLDTGLVEFANGGHNPPVVKRKNGKFEYLKNKVNLVLAGMEDMPYVKQEFRLYPGYILYLYTDGVT
ncbi:MAG: SpoIIE family protein phosphatase [Bacillota bacterium]|nr:SpoIIE family protein phosphatase [Bacillota bacterium]